MVRLFIQKHRAPNRSTGPLFPSFLSFQGWLNAGSLPEGHKDGVPFLMHKDLLRQDGPGGGLVLNQVVFSHKHPVGELGAAGRTDG